tara:strand:- start:33961 stop:41142 length:7182 start_codon:yes stop_codon:yes gene_type:complete
MPYPFVLVDYPIDPIYGDSSDVHGYNAVDPGLRESIRIDDETQALEYFKKGLERLLFIAQYAVDRGYNTHYAVWNISTGSPTSLKDQYDNCDETEWAKPGGSDCDFYIWGDPEGMVRYLKDTVLPNYVSYASDQDLINYLKDVEKYTVHEWSQNDHQGPKFALLGDPDSRAPGGVDQYGNKYQFEHVGNRRGELGYLIQVAEHIADHRPGLVSGQRGVAPPGSGIARGTGEEYEFEVNTFEDSAAPAGTFGLSEEEYQANLAAGNAVGPCATSEAPFVPEECPVCIPNASAPVPNWRTNGHGEVFLNRKTCEYCVTVVSNETNISILNDITSREAFLEAQKVSGVELILENFEKTPLDASTRQTVLNEAAAKEYDVPLRNLMPIKTLVCVPVALIESIQFSPTVDESIEEPPAGPVGVVLEAPKIRLMIRQVCEAFRYYGHQYALWSYETGQVIPNFDPNEEIRKLKKFVPVLVSLMNRNGFKLNGPGAAERVEFRFNEEYQVIYGQANEPYCEPVELLWKKEGDNLGGFKDLEPINDPRTMAYIAALPDIVADAGARKPMAWDKFFVKYTFPEITINEVNSPLGSTGVSDDPLHMAAQAVVDKIVSLPDAITAKFSSQVCRDSSSQLDYLNELGDLGGMLSRAQNSANSSLQLGDNIFLKLPELLEQSSNLDELSQNILNKLGQGGLLDLINTAFECLTKGVSLADTQDAVVSAAMKAMDSAYIEKIFTGLSPEMQTRIKNCVTEKGGAPQPPWESGYRTGSYNYNVADLNVGDENATVASQTAQFRPEAQTANVGTIGTASSNMMNADMGLYVDCILENVDTDYLLSEIEKFPGAELIAKILIKSECPPPPIFNPPLDSFMKTLDLDFNRGNAAIEMPEIPKFSTTDNMKSMMDGLLEAIIQIAVKVIVVILDMILKILLNGICNLLGLLGDLASGLFENIPSNNFANSIKDTLSDTGLSSLGIPLPLADDETINKAAADLFGSFSRACTDAESLPSAEESAAFLNEIGLVLTQGEFIDLTEGIAAKEVYDAIGHLVNLRHRSFLCIFPNNAAIEAFFMSLGAMIDPAFRTRTSPGLPVFPEVCSDVSGAEEVDNLRRMLLTNKNLDPALVDSQIKSLKCRAISDIEDLANIAQNGLFADMPPILDDYSDPSCPVPGILPRDPSPEMLPTGPIAVASGPAGAIEGMYSILEQVYIQDLMGPAGFLNMILSDRDGRSLTSHHAFIAFQAIFGIFSPRENTREMLLPETVAKYLEYILKNPGEAHHDAGYKFMNRQFIANGNPDLILSYSNYYPKKNRDWYSFKIKYTASDYNATTLNNRYRMELVESFKYSFDALPPEDEEVEKGKETVVIDTDPGIPLDIVEYIEDELGLDIESVMTAGFPYSSTVPSTQTTGNPDIEAAIYNLRVEIREASQIYNSNKVYVDATNLTLDLHSVNISNAPSNEYAHLENGLLPALREIDVEQIITPDTGQFGGQTYDRTELQNVRDELQTSIDEVIKTVKETINQIKNNTIASSAGLSAQGVVFGKYIEKILRDEWPAATPIMEGAAIAQSFSNIAEICATEMYGYINTSLFNSLASMIGHNNTAFLYGEGGSTFSGNDPVRYAPRKINLDKTHRHPVTGLPEPIDPIAFGGNDVFPSFYMQPPQNRNGWCGIADKMIPEVDACDPKRKNIVDFKQIGKQVMEFHKKIADDPRINQSSHCVLEPPCGKVMRRSTASMIEGLIKSTIRIYITEAVLKGMPSFVKFKADFNEVYDSLLARYITQTLKDGFLQYSVKGFGRRKNDEYYFQFLEQAVQNFGRKLDAGLVEATTEEQEAVDIINGLQGIWKKDPTLTSDKPYANTGEKLKRVMPPSIFREHLANISKGFLNPLNNDNALSIEEARKLKERSWDYFMREVEPYAEIILSRYIKEELAYISGEFSKRIPPEYKTLYEAFLGDSTYGCYGNIDFNTFAKPSSLANPFAVVHNAVNPKISGYAGDSNIFFEKYSNPDAEERLNPMSPSALEPSNESKNRYSPFVLESYIYVEDYDEQYFVNLVAGAANTTAVLSSLRSKYGDLESSGIPKVWRQHVQSRDPHLFGVVKASEWQAWLASKASIFEPLNLQKVDLWQSWSYGLRIVFVPPNKSTESILPKSSNLKELLSTVTSYYPAATRQNNKAFSIGTSNVDENPMSIPLVKSELVMPMGTDLADASWYDSYDGIGGMAPLIQGLVCGPEYKMLFRYCFNMPRIMSVIAVYIINAFPPSIGKAGAEGADGTMEGPYEFPGAWVDTHGRPGQGEDNDGWYKPSGPFAPSEYYGGGLNLSPFAVNFKRWEFKNAFSRTKRIVAHNFMDLYNLENPLYISESLTSTEMEEMLRQDTAPPWPKFNVRLWQKKVDRPYDKDGNLCYDPEDDFTED